MLTIFSLQLLLINIVCIHLFLTWTCITKFVLLLGNAAVICQNDRMLIATQWLIVLPLGCFLCTWCLFHSVHWTFIPVLSFMMVVLLRHRMGLIKTWWCFQSHVLFSRHDLWENMDAHTHTETCGFGRPSYNTCGLVDLTDPYTKQHWSIISTKGNTSYERGWS